MGIIDKLSGTLGLIDDEEEEQEKVKKPKGETKMEGKRTEKKIEPTVIPAFSAMDSQIQAPIENFVGHNVVDFNSEMAARKNMSAPMHKAKINTIRPKNFDHAQEVANSLRDKIPVIINFEETDTETAKRIIDFISGTTYALNGVIQKVSQNVFVCAPSNVAVAYTEEKKVKGDVPWLK